MKNKIFKIMGVAISVALVASLCVFAIPGATPAEAGAPGNQKWSAQTLPSSTSVVLYNGSDVTDYAVGTDGLTIYAVNTKVAANASGACLRSADGGQGWTALTVSTANASGNLVAVAVAPDDSNVVAVAERITGSAWDTVHISTNAGKTWTALPVAYDSSVAVADAYIMDVDVGPARTGTVFGREYVIAFADKTSTQVTSGDVQIIGKGATWATCGSSNTPAVGDVAGVHDYMAVKFSPNFVGDRVIAAVGANATAGNVVVHLINDAQKLQVRAPVAITTTATKTTEDYGVTSVGILTADIAIPSDFDPSVSSMQRTYISFGSSVAQSDNDVYRFTGSTVRDLDAVTDKAVESIAYTGTVDEGTLFMGEYADEEVKYTLDPTVSIPTWKSTKKKPSADPQAVNTSNAEVVVRVSPADPNVVFAGTSGPESAFSVSNDAAVAFDGESLIDNGVADTVLTVDDIYLTPDGATIFMATDDGSQISLWKSSLPTGSTSWSRVYVATGTKGMVRLNPDYGDTPTVYFADLAAGGNIYVSTNGGSTYSTRTAPALITASDIVVESSMTVYLAKSAASLVYKSTNGAWTWATPVDSKAGTIQSLAMAASYPNLPEAGHLLVGGTSAGSYSLDGGTVFTKIATGLTSGSTYQILAHPDYATNDTIFAADTGGTSYSVHRFIIGESTAWEDLIAISTGITDMQISGLGIASGVIYALTDENDGAHRSLSSTGAAGTLTWEAAGAGLATDATLNQTPSGLRIASSTNTLYAIDTSPTGTDADKVYAYSDALATDVAKLSGPADKATVNVDPVTGYADDIQLSWSAMGSGTGLVDVYQIQLCVSGTGFTAAFSTLYQATASTSALGGLNATNPQLSVGATGVWAQKLLANTDYDWRVRARDEVSNDTVRSNWSAVRTISVQAGGRVEQPYAGPILLGPTCGATGVSLTPGFSWAPMPRATEYEFILATDAGLTAAIGGTPAKLTSPAYQTTEKLAYGTVYFYAVKATKPTVSPQSICIFTTMEEPPAPAPPPVTIPPTPAPAAPITPGYIWAIIGIGAVLVIVVIVLIVRTRRAV